MGALQTAMQFTLRAEGGYWDDPIGGPTMWGVTQSTYDAYRKRKGLPLQSVRIMQQPERDEIVEYEYWIPAHCPDLPDKLAIAHFDWAYNHGVHGAIVSLQECLGVEADGIFGAKTKAAIDAAAPDTLVANYLSTRREWYKARAGQNAEAAKDLNGWLNRVDALQTFLAARA